MWNKESLTKIYSYVILLLSMLLIISGVVFTYPESSFDKIKQYTSNEKYALPFSVVKSTQKDTLKVNESSNFGLVLLLSIVIVLVVNLAVAFAVWFYFKKNVTVNEAENKTEKIIQPVKNEVVNEIEIESADERIHLAQQLGRGYGEIEVLQNLKSKQQTNYRYAKIADLIGTGNKQTLITTAKKLGVGSGEILLALKLNKLAEEKI